MSKKKTILIIVAVLLVAGMVAGTIIHSRGNVTPVTTVKVASQDLTATVSGTGQIRPKTFVNVGSTAFGRITHPHDLARLIAAEQIYRALTILAGHPYHSGH